MQKSDLTFTEEKTDFATPTWSTMIASQTEISRLQKDPAACCALSSDYDGYHTNLQTW